jgi:uncharacterized protein
LVLQIHLPSDGSFSTAPLGNPLHKPYNGYMNKLVVFSDLHGDMDMLRMIIARAEKEKADTILCAGDLGIHHSTIIAQMIRSSSIPFLIVRGNCDSPWAFVDVQLPVPPIYRTVDFCSRSILLTHGDRIQSWYDAPAKLSNNDIFIYGHSHVAMLSHSDHTPYILNPGSASRPRDSHEPSFAVISEKDIAIKEILSGLTIHGFSLRFS